MKRIIVIVFFAVAAALALSGCAEIFNAVFDTGAPSGVSASDGDNANSVDVSWGAPNLSSEKWKGKRVDYYKVTWSFAGGSSGSGTASSTSYSVPALDSDRAKVCSVTVQTYISGWGEGSASDDGFALLTEELLWLDGGALHTVAGSDVWYVTMLQRGFTYSFDFGAPGTGSVTFYDYKNITTPEAAFSGLPRVDWLCNTTGNWYKYYVHVTPASVGTSVTASFGW